MVYGKRQSEERHQDSGEQEDQLRHCLITLQLGSDYLWCQYLVWQLSIVSGENEAVTQTTVGSRMTEDRLCVMVERICGTVNKKVR